MLAIEDRTRSGYRTAVRYEDGLSPDQQWTPTWSMRIQQGSERIGFTVNRPIVSAIEYSLSG